MNNNETQHIALDALPVTHRLRRTALVRIGAQYRPMFAKRWQAVTRAYEIANRSYNELDGGWTTNMHWRAPQDHARADDGKVDPRSMVIHVDLFRTEFLGRHGGCAVGFQIADEDGIECVDTYDEWRTLDALRAAFPTEAVLREFVANESLYGRYVREGATVRIHGSRFFQAVG